MARTWTATCYTASGLGATVRRIDLVGWSQWHDRFKIGNAVEGDVVGRSARGSSVDIPAWVRRWRCRIQTCCCSSTRFLTVGGSGLGSPGCGGARTVRAGSRAGMSSFTAIADWAVEVSAELLGQLYGRHAEGPSKAFRVDHQRRQEPVPRQHVDMRRVRRFSTETARRKSIWRSSLRSSVGPHDDSSTISLLR